MKKEDIKIIDLINTTTGLLRDIGNLTCRVAALEKIDRPSQLHYDNLKLHIKSLYTESNGVHAAINNIDEKLRTLYERLKEKNLLKPVKYSECAKKVSKAKKKVSKAKKVVKPKTAKRKKK
jgi:hypothetical protein